MSKCSMNQERHHELWGLEFDAANDGQKRRPRSDNVRALIAGCLDVDVRRVTDGAHFSDDLGADWLDRLELMILIEDQFAGVEITDDDVDQMEVVGDLIRYLNARAALQRSALGI